MDGTDRQHDWPSWARRKLRDNTLIVFLSDNGPPFPREKGTLYDGGTRTPLIFVVAGVRPRRVGV